MTISETAQGYAQTVIQIVPVQILDFLQKPAFGLLSFIDYWMIFHLVAGFILGRFLSKLPIPVAKTGLVLLIAFEVWERTLMAPGVVMTESYFNQFLDVIFGYVGLKIAEIIG